MFIVDFIKKLFQKPGIGEKSAPEQKTQSIYHLQEEVEEIHSIWDYVKLNENTQASHICTVLGFEEWISMDEILRRIKELFTMDYKNDRSLYPYIKTLVDVGLVETNNVGGRKKWRKKDVILKVREKRGNEQKAKEEAKQTA